MEKLCCLLLLLSESATRRRRRDARLPEAIPTEGQDNDVLSSLVRRPEPVAPLNTRTPTNPVRGPLGDPLSRYHMTGRGRGDISYY